MICAMLSSGLSTASTVLFLKAHMPSMRPIKTETGAATNTNDKVCMAGSHWPKTEM